MGSTSARPSRRLMIQGAFLVAAGGMLMLSLLPSSSPSVTGHPVAGSAGQVLQRSLNAPATPPKLHLEFEVEPKTHDEMLALPVEKLGEMDIARVNLLCAAGLPTTKGLDVEHALATLDTWAERVASETDRYLHRVTDPRTAEHYGRSEAQYRA